MAHAETGEQAIDRLVAGGAADAIMLDLNMPGLGGLGALKELRGRGFGQPVVVLTATGGIDTVVKAMQAGAQDFFVKPASPERIMVSIRNALQLGDLKGEVDRLNKKASGRISFADLVGASPAMASGHAAGRAGGEVANPHPAARRKRLGKEVIARAVHGSSDRAGKPFVAVNCGAIPENLVESILFGHEKGSFTGATDKHLGKFQEANGGVLFLDEIGELPLDMQVKLLRALQEGEIDPIGSKRPTRVDVRIISATNRDLAQHVTAGPFPRGPLLSPERLPDRSAAAARAARGHSWPDRALHPPLQRRRGQAGAGRQRRDDGAAAGARVARQRPPAGKRGLPRHRPGRRPLPAALRLPSHLGHQRARRRRGSRAGPRPAARTSSATCPPTPRCGFSTSAAICGRSRRSNAT